MVKKISLNIPNDSYKELASLSDFYKQDIKEVLISILDAVGEVGQHIINLGKEYKVHVVLVYHTLFSVFDRLNVTACFLE